MWCLSLPSLSPGLDDGVIGGNSGVRLLPTGEVIKREHETSSFFFFFFFIDSALRVEPPVTPNFVRIKQWKTTRSSCNIVGWGITLAITICAL